MISNGSSTFCSNIAGASYNDFVRGLVLISIRYSEIIDILSIHSMFFLGIDRLTKISMIFFKMKLIFILIIVAH